MRVGLLSYPMLFQREGGLQVQLRSTLDALRQLGLADLHVELVDLNRQRLDDYDVLHVFSAINGNYRVVELAADLGVPVVLSALVSPAWNTSSGACARFADRLTGRLTGWNVHTSYAQTKRALQMASLVIALGAAERQSIVAAFRTDPVKIRVLPNGVERQFFQADASVFRRHTGITEPFVLMAGAISPYKNQLALAQALQALGLPVVLAGAAQPHHHDYLQQLLRLPHVRSLGQLAHEDPLLASAYAAAAVLALPSQGEVFPLVVLEALAAGTPAVMTRESALYLPDSGFALRQLRTNDMPAWCDTIAGWVAAPPDRQAVRALVEQFTWQRVAHQLVRYYGALHAGAAAGREPLRAI
jgi:glycosyltransferase involved in cell wall biosynthesis